jgi:hypothetical protein
MGAFFAGLRKKTIALLSALSPLVVVATLVNWPVPAAIDYFSDHRNLRVANRDLVLSEQTRNLHLFALI